MAPAVSVPLMPPWNLVASNWRVRRNGTPIHQQGETMKRIVTTVVLTALATACATNDGWAWDKPGSTQQSFGADHRQCRAQAFSVPGVTILQAALVLDGCMHGKGWQKVAYSTPRPAPSVAPIAAARKD